MAGTAVEFLTPVGRLVQGHCFEPQTEDMKGNPLVYLDGLKKGQPKTQYFIAVAFAKTDPAWPAFRALIDNTARRDFPTLFPTPGGPCVNPNFAYKVIDGDGVDQNGTRNATKEGFAGHWVVRLSTMYPPKCFAAGKYQPHEQLAVVGGVNPIPRGYKVRVAGTIKGNDDTSKPGLHVSHTLIEFASVDTVITSGPDAAAVFGGGAAGGAAPGALLPVAGAAHSIESLRASGWSDDQIVSGGFATRAPAAPPATPAPPPPAAASAPPPPVQPHTAILTPLAKVMTPAAGATTYEAYIAAGWTDAMLIEKGMMVAPAAAAPAPPPLVTSGSAAPPPPAAIAAAAPPPPAAGKVMLPAAGATTYDAYIAAGWTDAMLIQNGFMSA